MRPPKAVLDLVVRMSQEDATQEEQELIRGLSDAFDTGDPGAMHDALHALFGYGENWPGEEEG